MKEKYEVKSERYGYTHSFIQVDKYEYRFVPAEDWMPISISYENKDKRNVTFVDTDGGPCIGKGWTNGEIIVKDIRWLDNGLIFTLEDNEQTSN